MVILGKPGRNSRTQAGFTLIETAIALALLIMIVIIFVLGVASSSKFTYLTDVRDTAESLARSQMEWAKNLSYSYNATSYPIYPVPDTPDFSGFSVAVSAESLHTPDDGIQKITVTVNSQGTEILSLEGYKPDR